MDEETKDNSYNSAKTQRIPVVRLGGDGWKRILKRLQGKEPFIVYYRPYSAGYRWIPIFRSRFSQRIGFDQRKSWTSRQISDYKILLTPVERGGKVRHSEMR